MIILLILFGIAIMAIAPLAVVLTSEPDSRINNWTFIIDLLFKTGYKPNTISKILDYYTI